MKLHRADVKPEWARVAAKKRNRWQQQAAQTNGIVTPGNFVTILGLILVVIGGVFVLQKHYALGILLIAVGRLCDILDGWAADWSGTKSSLGATIDASADKLATFYTMAILVIAHSIPWLAAVAIVFEHVIILYPSSVAVKRGIPIRPSRSGKYGMATTWLAATSYIAGMLFDDIPGATFRFFGLILILVSLVFTGHAAISYFRQYLKVK